MFIVIDRAMWRRGVALFLLVVAAGVFYLASKVQESSGSGGGELVFRPEQAAPEPASAPVWVAEVPEPAVETAGGVSLSSPQASGSGVQGRFDQLRIERSQGRSRRLEALEEALDDEGIPEEVRASMRREMMALVERMQLEQEIEGLLVARGLSDAVVVLRDRAAEVVVAEVLDRDQAAQVGDLVARIGGVPLEGIVIVDGAAVR